MHPALALNYMVVRVGGLRRDHGLRAVNPTRSGEYVVSESDFDRDHDRDLQLPMHTHSNTRITNQDLVFSFFP